MRHINRRQFLKSSVCGAAAFSLAWPRRVLGANERVNVALIGCGGRGRYLARGTAELGAEVTYLCDLHPGRLDKAANKLLKRKYCKKYEVPENV